MVAEDAQRSADRIADVYEGVAEQAAEHLLQIILGDTWNPAERPELLKTPRRFVDALREILVPDDEGFEFTTFPNTKKKSEMVTVGPIAYHSVCSHHVLPFFGEAWIGYVPDKVIAGLSKLPRTVKWMSRGLWTQEDLTSEIAVFLEEQLAPVGVAVLMTGEHLCMTIRGVETPGAITTTSEMRGCFIDPEKQARMEFYNNVRR